MSQLVVIHGAAALKTITSGLVMNKQGKLLTLLRADDKSDGSTWGMPGGKKLPHEREVHGAIREVSEETGLQTRLLTTLGTTERSDKRFVDFLLLADDSANVMLNEEHRDYKWVALHDWPQPAHPVTHKILTQQAERILRFADALKPTSNQHAFDL